VRLGQDKRKRGEDLETEQIRMVDQLGLAGSERGCTQITLLFSRQMPRIANQGLPLRDSCTRDACKTHPHQLVNLSRATTSQHPPVSSSSRRRGALLFSRASEVAEKKVRKKGKRKVEKEREREREREREESPFRARRLYARFCRCRRNTRPEHFAPRQDV
jgi:triphosphoribosyl-dephospho-CoA synthetase